MWVFGYGSLIWKADFPFHRKLKGYITGFQRRFWQGSEDHRGVPGKPGRVVTLIKSNAMDKVWGLAYEIKAEDGERVKKHLDFREKGGYETHLARFYPVDGSTPFDIEIYIGNEHNPFFLGDAPSENIAKQIYESKGPSGSNIEYLLELTKALREIIPKEDMYNDSHIFDLELHVVVLMERTSVPSNIEV